MIFRPWSVVRGPLKSLSGGGGQRGREPLRRAPRATARRAPCHTQQSQTLPGRVTTDHRPRTTDNAAFTLVEMLIAVGVLAILAVVVLPTVRSTEAQSLESVARVVMADLRLARGAAIQNNTEWTVRFDTAANAYELVHTGTGSPPPLENPLAPAEDDSGRYLVDLDRFGTMAARGRFRLAAVVLKDSGQPVSDVTFGPLGGTGPTRGEDTVLWLSAGTGREMTYVRLTISWITGQVWADRPQAFGTTSAG